MFESLKVWWYSRRLQSTSRRKASRAAEALGRLRDLRAVEPLIQVLQYPGNAREEVAGALGRIGDPRAVEPLIQLLKYERHYPSYVSNALRQFDDALVVESLIRALDDEDYRVRSAAARALGRLSGPRAVEPLIEALGDQSSEIRPEAAAALAQIGDARAVEPLIDALGDQSSGIRFDAAAALAQIGDARAVEPLIEALGDQSSEIRRGAAAALARWGHGKWSQWVKGGDGDFDRLGTSKDPEAVKPLVYGLNQFQTRIATAAAEALAKLGDPRAVAPLIRVLGHTDLNVCETAARALGRLGDVRAVEPLIHNMNRGGRSAVKALVKLGGSRAVEPLIHALGGDSADIRLAAAEALGKLGDPRAVEPLIRALDRGDGSERAAAAQALEKLGDPRATEPLIRALGRGDGSERAAAARALEKLGDPRATEPLIRALGHSDGSFRRAAVAVLARLGHTKWAQWVEGDVGDFRRLGASEDPEAIEPLVCALGYGDCRDRAAAAKALERLGDTKWAQWVKGNDEDFERLGASKAPEVVEPLVCALAHDDADCCAAAATALGNLGDPQAVAPLVRALERVGKPEERGSQRLIYTQPFWAARKAVARALVAIGARDPDALKSHWPRATQLITEPHEDSHSDEDRSWTSSDCHVDSHSDRGIGLEFPEPSAVSPQAVDSQDETAKPLLLPCPHCNNRLKIPGRLAGQAGRCPACKGEIQIPAPPDTKTDVEPDF